LGEISEMMRLALDHITVVDAGPMELVSTAAAVGCAGICLFMEPMAVLPQMPPFDLYGDAAQRRELRGHLQASGVTLDLAYPFTIAGRTEVADLEPALICAAELGAGLVNALIYDRDAARRLDKLGAFGDLAEKHGLGVALEFYPVSQTRSLADALELVQAIHRPGRVGINADLLHLMRSGGSIAELAAAPPEFILYGQVADGPAECTAETLDEEASQARLLVGEGVFDVAAFMSALPDHCPISVEIPRNSAISSEDRVARASRAVQSVRHARAQPDVRP
jgi:sugar phosphate isomerase/epimerase